MSIFLHSFQFFLSEVKFSSKVIDAGSLMFMFISPLFKSFLIVRIQVFAGRPLLFMQGWKQYLNAFRTGVSGCSRMICPRNVNLLRRIVLLHISAFVTLYFLSKFQYPKFRSHVPVSGLQRLISKFLIWCHVPCFRSLEALFCFDQTFCFDLINTAKVSPRWFSPSDWGDDDEEMTKWRHSK